MFWRLFIFPALFTEDGRGYGKMERSTVFLDDSKGCGMRERHAMFWYDGWGCGGMRESLYLLWLGMTVWDVICMTGL